MVGWPPVIFAGILRLLLDFIFSLSGFFFSLFKLLQSFAINANVEGNNVFFVVLVDFASMGGVVNQKVFSFLFVFQINSSDVGIVVSDWININLQNVRIDLSVTLN